MTYAAPGPWDWTAIRDLPYGSAGFYTCRLCAATCPAPSLAGGEHKAACPLYQVQYGSTEYLGVMARAFEPPDPDGPAPFYVVGEKGPELFTHGRPGIVVPGTIETIERYPWPAIPLPLLAGSIPIPVAPHAGVPAIESALCAFWGAIFGALVAFIFAFGLSALAYTQGWADYPDRLWLALGAWLVTTVYTTGSTRKARTFRAAEPPAPIVTCSACEGTSGGVHTCHPRSWGRRQ